MRAQFSDVGLSGVASAYANIGYTPPALFDAIENAVDLRMDSMSARTLVNTAWALVVLARTLALTPTLG